jgi:hypothetical protein
VLGHLLIRGLSSHRSLSFIEMALIHMVIFRAGSALRL